MVDSAIQGAPISGRGGAGGWGAGLVLLVVAWSSRAAGQDLVVDGTTLTLGGRHAYRTVQVLNGGRIVVPAFDGTDRQNTGNLELVAGEIYVDSSSAVLADGKGYQPVLCGDGNGPTPDAGGRGGCSVRDSGGGGAHFGRGGRGTKDCFVYGDRNTCQFPQEWEEDCGFISGPNQCTFDMSCWDLDADPPVWGEPYVHSIYDVEFGAAGGDKGCGDGDGWNCRTAGAGGGRIVLVATSRDGTGLLRIEGRVSADGWRGCGSGNDSAGGGAGGSVLLIGDQVEIADGARVSAAGGLGGDTQGHPDCPPCAQSGGTCDDCGGGGGGGIVSILSGRPAQLGSLAAFDVSGALGGTCPICNGEAGGGAGELQLDGIYVGEYCDGYDNDFDGLTDEDLGDVTCGTGACRVTVPACDPNTHEPVDCVPLSVPSCQEPLVDTRSRFLVILDTSGSMLTDLSGNPTFGDGSAEHPGLDTNGDGIAGNDSRLYQAKEAVTAVVSAYPDLDYALARYRQHTGQDMSCLLAHWVECADICCSYDDPSDNTGPESCTVAAGAAGDVPIRPNSTGEECINYVGWCGPPRRGADILVGFGKDPSQILMWLDHRETRFDPDTTEGDFCSFVGGGDCELRGSGPTPLAGALLAAKAYLAKIKALDPIADCRNYGVILVTDGAETCLGDPVAAAAELLGDLGIQTYVVGFSVLPEERSSLNAIAAAGGTGSAYFASDQESLAAALATVVASSIVFETCNGQDDDCDGLTDEDFPLLGRPCDDGRIGRCRGTGTYQCRADGTGVQCVITNPGADPQPEVCNGQDDDCNGQVDEGLDCTSHCEPNPPEVCNGVDDDCDGAVDEEDPMLDEPCGETPGQVSGLGQCEPGHYVCAGGQLVCVGGVGPMPEMCNGVDDDCDGETDEEAECPGESVCIEGNCRWPCGTGEFPCPGGFECKEYVIDGEPGRYCVPSPCMDCAEGEVCIDDQCVDLCENVECGENEVCVQGVCRDCHTLGCPDGHVCHASECIPDPCAAAGCNPETETCVDGECVALCFDMGCGEGQLCRNGQCVEDPCAGADCGPGLVCSEGACVSDPCAGIVCPIGDVCVWPGECVDDPCPKVHCGAGGTCRVGRDGRVFCEPPRGWSPPPPPEKVLLTGGGGRGCRAAGRRPAPLWVPILAFFWFRRSRVRP